MIEVGKALMTIMTNDGDDDDAINSKEKDESPIAQNEVNLMSTIPVAPLPVQNSARSKASSQTQIDTNANDTKKKVLATPAVRRMSMEYRLDLSSINGTGKDGRILKSDILTELHQTGVLNDNSIDAKPSAVAAQEEAHVPVSSGGIILKDEIVSIRGYNRIMVKAMTSTLAVPHMVYSDEIDMSALKRCREEMKPIAEIRNIKLSYLPFAVKACSLAMKECPIMNSTIDADEMTLTYHRSHDIGVAIDSPRGLVVPVIRNCQELSIMDIAEELSRLRELVSIKC